MYFERIFVTVPWETLDSLVFIHLSESNVPQGTVTKTRS